MCTTSQQQQERWRRHFTNVLNIMSEFDEEELNKVEQRPVRMNKADLPTDDELNRAVGRIKSGKVARKSGK